jgi:hypothetical protein
MITYKWSIEKLVTTGTTNLVTHAYWFCFGTDGNLTAACAGIRELPSNDSFTAYDQLTEQQVLDWCFTPEVITLADSTTLAKLLKDEGEAQIAGQIQRQLDKVNSVPALPWAEIPA